MKRLTIKDILKHGAKLSAFKLPDDEATKQMINDCKRKQQEILDSAKVDWNNPALRKPMDI